MEAAEDRRVTWSAGKAVRSLLFLWCLDVKGWSREEEARVSRESQGGEWCSSLKQHERWRCWLCQEEGPASHRRKVIWLQVQVGSQVWLEWWGVSHATIFSIVNDVRSSLTVRQVEGSLKCWENAVGMKQVLCKVGEGEYYRNRLKLTGRTGGPA